MSDLFSNVIQQIDKIHEKYGDNPTADTMLMERNPELDKVISLANGAGLQIAAGFIPPELVTTGLMNEEGLKQYIVSTRENVDPDFGKFGGHDWLSGLDKNASTDIKLSNEEILGLLPSIIPESTLKITMLSEKSFVKDADGNFVHSVEKFSGDEFKMDVDGKEYTGLDLYRVKVEMRDGHNGYLMFSADNTGRTLLGYDSNLTGKDITDEKGVGLNVDGPATERYMPSLDVTNTWEKLPNESDEAFKDRIDDFKEKYDEARSASFENWLDRHEATDAVRQENIADRKTETKAIIDKDQTYLNTARTYENILNTQFEKNCDRIKTLITGTDGFNETVTQKTDGWEDKKASIVKDIAAASQDMYKTHMAKSDCIDAVKPLETYRSMADSLQMREDTYTFVVNKGRPTEETFPQMMEHFDELDKINESKRHNYTSNVNPMRYDEALKFEQMANERDGWKPLTIRDKVVETISRMSVRTTAYPSPSAESILPRETQYIKDVCIPYIHNAVEEFNADREPDMHVSFNEEKGVLEGNEDSIKELTTPNSEYGTHMDIEEFIAFPFTMDEKGEKQKVEMSQEDKSEVKGVILFTRDLVQEGGSIDGYSAEDLINNKRMDADEEDKSTTDDNPSDNTNNDNGKTDTGVADTGNTNADDEKDSIDDDEEDRAYSGYVVPVTQPITREDGTPMRSLSGGRMATPQSRALMFGIGLLQFAFLGPFGLIAIGIAAGASIDAVITKDKMQKENADLELVKQDGSLIKYIEKPSEKVMLTAINQNPAAILNIKDPTEKAMIRAFGKDGILATKAEPNILTEKGMISAVTNAPDIIKDLPSDRVTDNVRDAADTAKERQIAFVTADPENIKHLNNPCSDARQVVIDKRPDLAVKYLDGKLTDEQQVDIVTRRPDLTKDMKVVCQDAQSKLVAMDDSNYKLIGTPTKQTQMELVGKNGLNIRMVNNPSLDIMKAAIDQNPAAIFGMRKPPEGIIKEALSKDGMIAERLSKNVLTKDMVVTAVKNAPDLENSKAIDKSLITDEVKAAAKEARTEQCDKIEKDPSSIADMKNPCRAARNLAIEKNPMAAAKGIANPTKEEKLAIVEKDPSAAVHLKQDQAVQSKLAERIDGYQYIKEPTVATKVQYVTRFPEKLQAVYDGNPPASVVKDIVENDPSTLKYVDKADWDTVSSAISKDAKAVAFNAKPGILADDHKIVIVSISAETLKAPAIREGGIPEMAARAAMTGHDSVTGKEALSLVFDGCTPEQSKTVIGNDEAKTEKFAKYAVWQDRSAITEIKDPDMRLAVIQEVPSAIVALDNAGITPTDDEVKAVAMRLDSDDKNGLTHDTYERIQVEEKVVIDQELKDNPPEPYNAEKEFAKDVAADNDDDHPTPEEFEQEKMTKDENPDDDKEPSVANDREDSVMDGKESVNTESPDDKGKPDVENESSDDKSTIVNEKDDTAATDSEKVPAVDEKGTAATGDTKNEDPSDGNGKSVITESSVDGKQPDKDTDDSDKTHTIDNEERKKTAAGAKKETDAVVDIAGSVGAVSVNTDNKEEEKPITEEKEPEDSESIPLTDEEMASSEVAEDTVSDAERDALESRTQADAENAMNEQAEADTAKTDTTPDATVDSDVDVTDLLPSAEDFYNAATGYEDKDSLEGFITNLSEAFSDLDGVDAVAGYLDVMDAIKDMTEMYMTDDNGMSDVTFASAFQDICDAAAQVFKDAGILSDTDDPYDTADIMDMVMDDVKKDFADDQTALERLDGLQNIIDDTNPVTADDEVASDGAEANAAEQDVTNVAVDESIKDVISDEDRSSLITQDALDELAQKMTDNGIAADNQDNTVVNEADSVAPDPAADIVRSFQTEMDLDNNDNVAQ